MKHFLTAAVWVALVAGGAAVHAQDWNPVEPGAAGAAASTGYADTEPAPLTRLVDALAEGERQMYSDELKSVVAQQRKICESEPHSTECDAAALDTVLAYERMIDGAVPHFEAAVEAAGDADGKGEFAKLRRTLGAQREALSQDLVRFNGRSGWDAVSRSVGGQGFGVDPKLGDILDQRQQVIDRTLALLEGASGGPNVPSLVNRAQLRLRQLRELREYIKAVKITNKYVALERYVSENIEGNDGIVVPDPVPLPMTDPLHPSNRRASAPTRRDVYR
jgi:hypothetical protein